MNAPALALERGARTRPSPRYARPLRVWLVAGCLLAALAAARLGTPSARLLADPELARLLRGMALIKGLFLLGAVAALLWRFGRPIGARVGVAYVAGAWTLAFATLLVWQLAAVMVAAALFHAAEIFILVLAWRDGRFGTRHSG